MNTDNTSTPSQPFDFLRCQSPVNHYIGVLTYFDENDNSHDATLLINSELNLVGLENGSGSGNSLLADAIAKDGDFEWLTGEDSEFRWAAKVNYSIATESDLKAIRLTCFYNVNV